MEFLENERLWMNGDVLNYGVRRNESRGAADSLAVRITLNIAVAIKHEDQDAFRSHGFGSRRAETLEQIAYGGD